MKKMSEAKIEIISACVSMTIAMVIVVLGIGWLTPELEISLRMACIYGIESGTLYLLMLWWNVSNDKTDPTVYTIVLLVVVLLSWNAFAIGVSVLTLIGAVSSVKKATALLRAEKEKQ